MPQITIELSPDALDYLEAERAAGRGPSIDALIARAVADYRQARGLEELDRLTDEAIESGESTELTPAFWERKKQELLSRPRASSP